MKYSKFQGTLRWSGGTVVLRKGQSIDDDHPLAFERPELFGDQNPGAEIPSGPPNIERATNAPGESRNTPGVGPRGSAPRVPKAGSTQ